HTIPTSLSVLISISARTNQRNDKRKKAVTTMNRLTNKNILITGGNSGIGMTTAQEFDREGARVAICGLNEKTLKAAQETLGAGSLAVRTDVSNLADLDAMVTTINQEVGQLDGMFVNEGHSDVRSFLRRRAGRCGQGVAADKQSEQAAGRSGGNREAGSLPRVGRFCVRRRGRLPDRRRGHGDFGRWRLSHNAKATEIHLHVSEKKQKKLNDSMKALKHECN